MEVPGREPDQGSSRDYRRSDAVGLRPTVIQIPSGSVTLAIQPLVVEGSKPVGLAPNLRRRA